MSKSLSLVLLFVFMMGLVFAADASRSSVVQTDFYIPENVSATTTVGSDAPAYSFAWVFWGVGILIVVLVLLVGLSKMKKRTVVSAKSVKVVKTKVSPKKRTKRSSKRKK